MFIYYVQGGAHFLHKKSPRVMPTIQPTCFSSWLVMPSVLPRTWKRHLWHTFATAYLVNWFFKLKKKKKTVDGWKSLHTNCDFVFVKDLCLVNGVGRTTMLNYFGEIELGLFVISLSKWCFIGVVTLKKKSKLLCFSFLPVLKKKNKIGTHIGKPGVTYTKAHELVLEPLSDNTCWDFDGERAANATTHVSVMHGAATLAC